MEFSKNFLLACLCTLFFISCSKDNDDGPNTATSSISVECNRDKSDAFQVNEEVVFTINMKTDPGVGIDKFTIAKLGDEIFARDDYTANEVNFQFTYGTTSEDVSVGDVVFDFVLTDKNGVVKSESATVRVAVDLPVVIENLRPEPGWNVVTDRVVDASNPDEVDILLVGSDHSFSFLSGSF